MQSLFRQSLRSLKTLSSIDRQSHRLMTTLTTTRRQSTHLRQQEITSSDDMKSDETEDNKTIVETVFEEYLKQSYKDMKDNYERVKKHLREPSMATILKTLDVKMWRNDINEQRIDFDGKSLDSLMDTKYWTLDTLKLINVSMKTCDTCFHLNESQITEPKANIIWTLDGVLDQFNRVNERYLTNNRKGFEWLVSEYVYLYLHHISLDQMGSIEKNYYYNTKILSENRMCFTDMSIIKNNKTLMTIEVKDIIVSDSFKDNYLAQSISQLLMSSLSNNDKTNGIYFGVLVRSMFWHFFSAQINEHQMKSLRHSSINSTKQLHPLDVYVWHSPNGLNFNDPKERQLISKYLTSIVSIKQ
ncbi:uncharacterized protein LOC128965258 [Oppia nitens]|uniref:uncharacterized protein LOC128965258 n=1 Tax=Oppia nitens TaxID=1686743 RepID=UPI0023DB854A|nr:uncharacterized protein LOC128965258 [Oppia nitens]